MPNLVTLAMIKNLLIYNRKAFIRLATVAYLSKIVHIGLPIYKHVTSVNCTLGCNLGNFLVSATLEL